jgi:hypothetical protein
MENINTLANKLGVMHIAEKCNVDNVSQALKALKIDDKNQKRLIGTDHQEDDDYYVITCAGVDETSNVCVKLRVKRKKC